MPIAPKFVQKPAHYGQQCLISCIKLLKGEEVVLTIPYPWLSDALRGGEILTECASLRNSRLGKDSKDNYALKEGHSYLGLIGRTLYIHLERFHSFDGPYEYIDRTTGLCTEYRRGLRITDYWNKDRKELRTVSILEPAICRRELTARGQAVADIEQTMRNIGVDVISSYEAELMLDSRETLRELFGRLD